MLEFSLKAPSSVLNHSEFFKIGTLVKEERREGKNVKDLEV